MIKAKFHTMIRNHKIIKVEYDLKSFNRSNILFSENCQKLLKI